MAKWTIGNGDDRFVIEVIDRRITLAIPSGKPIEASPEAAQDLCTKLGFAINLATHPDGSTS
jgi:hypothetical protein